MRRFLVVALACALAACTKSGGASDLAVPNATLACPPLTSYCDHALPSAPCAPTLADARALFCLPDGGARPGGGPPALTADCGGVRLVSVSGVDTAEHFYYDVASGALVAVVGVSANFGGSTACDGGPATFTLQNCQPSVAFCG